MQLEAHILHPVTSQLQQQAFLLAMQDVFFLTALLCFRKSSLLSMDQSPHPFLTHKRRQLQIKLVALGHGASRELHALHGEKQLVETFAHKPWSVLFAPGIPSLPSDGR
jgi:hypothetical protein